MLDRFGRIHECLKAGRKTTSASLAADLGVTRRTIKRDIRFMRDRHAVPIAYDAVKRSYHYTEPCDALPPFWITTDEAVALMAANHTFAALAGSPFGQKLNSALRKFSKFVGSTMSFTMDSMSEAIFSTVGVPDTQVDYLAQLNSATERRKEVTIRYQNAHETEIRTRLVHPLHLAHADSGWMLLAYDLLRRDIRCFLLSRMHEVTYTGAHFSRPRDFDAAKILRGNFGRYTGAAPVTVRVALDKFAAFYALERKWHLDQTHVALPDGRTELTLPLNNHIDIEYHILKWGLHAEALSPLALRQSVHRALLDALEYYKNDPIPPPAPPLPGRPSPAAPTPPPPAPAP